MVWRLQYREIHRNAQGSAVCRDVWRTWEEKRELVRAASPIQYASAKLCPILSMCSDSDVRVPYTQSVEFCQAASGFGNDARHVTVPNQGHGYFEGDEYYQMIYDFLDKHMK